MKIEDAVSALSALAHANRLAAFRLLVEAGPQGLNCTEIGERLGLAPATLSFHLAQLARAGLVTSRQQSRFIFYAANFARMDEVLAYLTDDCCGGQDCLPRVAGARRRAARCT
jgi:DNA-binding transcriptional ArsR family regulator